MNHPRPPTTTPPADKARQSTGKTRASDPSEATAHPFYASRCTGSRTMAGRLDQQAVKEPMCR